MAFACKMMRLYLMILHTPWPKLVILGRQGLETWGGREVGEPNEREKEGELCKNA